MQLFNCFVQITLGIFRSKRFSHFPFFCFSFSHACMCLLSVSRCSDKSSVVFMCNAYFDSKLIFYACVPAKKNLFLYMCYVEVEIRTKLKNPVTAVFMKISYRDEFSWTPCCVQTLVYKEVNIY